MPWSSQRHLPRDAARRRRRRAGDLQAGPRRAPAVGLPRRAVPPGGGGLPAVATRSGSAVVPPTILRADAPLGDGSLQWFVEADFEQHYFTLYEERPELHDQLRTICAFRPPRQQHRPQERPLPARRPTGRCGRSTTGCASAEDFKLRTVIWEFAGEAIPRRRCSTDVAALADAVPAEVAELLDARRDRRPARRAPGRCWPTRCSRSTAPAAATPGRWSDREDDAHDPDTDGALDRARRPRRPRRAGAPRRPTVATTRDWDGLLRLRDRCRRRACAPGASSGRPRRSPSTGWPSLRPGGVGRPRARPTTPAGSPSDRCRRWRRRAPPWAELAAAPRARPDRIARGPRARPARRGPGRRSASRRVQRPRPPARAGAVGTRLPAGRRTGRTRSSVPRRRSDSTLRPLAAGARHDRSCDDGDVELAVRRAGRAVDGRVERRAPTSCAVEVTRAAPSPPSSVRRARPGWHRLDRRPTALAWTGVGRRQRWRPRPAPGRGGRPLRRVVGGRRARGRDRRRGPCPPAEVGELAGELRWFALGSRCARASAGSSTSPSRTRPRARLGLSRRPDDRRTDSTCQCTRERRAGPRTVREVGVGEAAVGVDPVAHGLELVPLGVARRAASRPSGSGACPSGAGRRSRS